MPSGGPSNFSILPALFMIGKFFRKIWGIWFYLNWALWFFPLYPFFLLFLSRPAWYPYAHACRRIWGRILFFAGGLRVKVYTEEQLSKDKTYIVVPNHSSYLDIPCTTCFLPMQLNYMAKSELSKIPMFGIFFRTIDISVNRKSNIDAHRAFIKAAEQLKKRERSMVIFPEGTISGHAPRLGRFKEGPFRLAVENGIDLLPVTFTDNWKKLPDDGSWEAEPGLLRMFIHRPIPTVGLNLSDAGELRQKVFTIIESKLKEYGDHKRTDR
jgi:1-acyl-sn-glycerol-3-phosphate acyltransferase